MPYWMHLANWLSMGAMMIGWLLLIAVIGCAAVLVSWWDADRHGRPKSA